MFLCVHFDFSSLFLFTSLLRHHIQMSQQKQHSISCFSRQFFRCFNCSRYRSLSFVHWLSLNLKYTIFHDRSRNINNLFTVNHRPHKKHLKYTHTHNTYTYGCIQKCEHEKKEDKQGLGQGPEEERLRVLLLANTASRQQQQQQEIRPTN